MTGDQAGPSFSRFLVPGIGIGLVVLFGLLFFVDHNAYQSLLAAWMLHPFPHPFIDWEYFPAAAECWSRGIDVYSGTPCYDIAPMYKMSYSPLWLRLSFLPTDPVGVAVFGLIWVVLFWVMQVYLPPPRTHSEIRLTLLVALSSLTAFALERANVDTIIFSLALLGANLWLGSLRLRLLAYAVFLLAGLLKFYPLILLLLVVRERPRIFLLVAGTTTLTLIAAASQVYRELIAASQNIPIGSYFTDLFGAVNLPFGLPVLAGYIASKLGSPSASVGSFTWISKPLYLSLATAAVAMAVVLASRVWMQRGITSLPPLRKALLLVGAALLCGCFFAGQSVGYRGVFLILVLPGLFELRRTLPAVGARCMQSVLYCVVFVAWVLTIEFISKRFKLTRGYDLDLDGFGLLHWFLHELCWWFIITVLLAILMTFVVQSPMADWGRSVLTGRGRAAT